MSKRPWYDHFDSCARIKELRDRVFDAEIALPSTTTVDLASEEDRNPREILQAEVNEMRSTLNSLYKFFQDKCWGHCSSAHCKEAI